MWHKVKKRKILRKSDLNAVLNWQQKRVKQPVKL